MKKKNLFILLILAVAVMLLGVACNKGTETTPEKVTSLTLNEESISVCVYQSELLVVDYDGDKTLSWSSSDQSVVSVDNNGMITANKIGSATITVTDGNVSDTCGVTVTAIDIYDLTYEGNDIDDMYVGQTNTLSVSVKYNGTTINVPSFTYESSNEEVATVSTTGVITANKIGEATISLTTVIGGNETGCSVIVRVLPSGKVAVNSDLIELDALAGDGRVNSLTPDVTVYEKGAVKANASVLYESSDEGVFTVSSNGLVTAISAGEALLTVKYTGEDNVVVEDVVSVKVNKVNFVLNKTLGDVFINDGATVDFDELLGQDYGTVSSVAVKYGNVLIPVDFTSNSLDFSLVNVYGANKLLISTENAEYEVGVEIWTAKIANASDMTCLYDAVGGWYKIVNDIDMSSVDWSPSEGNIFTGVLDGDNHSINGFDIDGTSGLFVGIGSGAVIKNININGATITENARATGLFASNVMYTAYIPVKVENVSIDVSIYGSQCGGLFGTVESGTTLEISNSYIHTYTPTIDENNGALVGQGSLVAEAENLTLLSALSACGGGTDIGINAENPVAYSRDIKMYELAEEGYADYNADASIGSTIHFYGRNYQTKSVTEEGKFTLDEDIVRTCVGKNVEVLILKADNTLESYYTLNLLPEYHLYRRNLTMLREIDNGVISLKEDIDMNGISWPRYYYEKHPHFSGVFDGEGHAIKNFNKAESTGEAAISLFYYLDGTEEQPAIVKNVAFVDAVVTSGNAVISTRARNAHFENVFVSISKIANGSAGALVSANEKMSVKDVYISMPDFASISSTKPSSYLTGLYSRIVSVDNLIVSGGNISTGGTIPVVSDHADVEEVITGADGVTELTSEDFIQFEDVFAFGDKINKDQITVSQMIEDALFEFVIIKVTKTNLSVIREGGNKFYMLAEDIDMSDVTWAQYGANDYKTNMFTGVFDGMGYTISNFTTSGSHTGGLFCNATEGTIRNLIMTNVSVSGTSGILASRAGKHLGGTNFVPLKIENVLIKVSSASSSNSCALVAAAYALDVKNTIIDMSACSNGNFISTTYNRALATENVYFIGTRTTNTSASRVDEVYSESGITKFDNYNAFNSGNKTLNSFLTSAVNEVYQNS